MTNKAGLVQNDTGPSLIFTIADNQTGEPIDISGGSAVMHLRKVGETEVKESMDLVLVAGIERQNWAGTVTLSTASPYNVAGSGGRVRLDWSATALDTVGEFEGEIEVTTANGRHFTVDRKARFRVRGEVA